MPLIDTSYFTLNLSITALSNPSKIEGLGDAINRYEPEYLRKILGLSLYNAFMTGTDTEGEVVPDALWLAIRDGKEWTDSGGKLHRWIGLINEDKVSPIANYVYFQHLNSGGVQMSTTGAYRIKRENATEADARPLLCRAWNAMVDMNNELVRLLDGNLTDYGQWWPTGYYYNVDYQGRDLFRKTNTFGI